ncbi:MAG: hypothetical protein Q4G43_09795 [Mobilicoccus sp.]|nr:hypothetical protein [Mobilicoccus sp.]
MNVLVVDGANVVGSVPDGWWKDRAGAARRLHTRLGEQDLPYDVIELVLEGQAKAGVPEGEESGVVTVHAPGEGDDEIVHRCRHHTVLGHAVALATADRGLIDRVAGFGVEIVGPRSVRGR